MAHWGVHQREAESFSLRVSYLVS